MVFSALKQAANRLAATVLAADAASIPPVPPAFNPADTVGSRTKLQGAIARAPGPLYYLIPDVASVHTSRSKQISISEDGDPASASDRSETAFATLNIDTVMYGILRTAGGSAEIQMTVGGTPTGPPVSFSPIVGTPFDSLSVTIGVGAPQTITIAQAVALINGSWIPWAGAPGAPPAIPIQAGIPTIASADAAPIDQASFLGPVGSPDRAMRTASLGLVLTGFPTSCAHTASLVGGIIGNNIARPLSVALACIQPPANPADGPILSAARLAAPLFFAAFAAAIDAISAHHHIIITANANLAAHGVAVGFSEAGRHIGQQLQAAEAIAAHYPATAPPPAADPVAAAIAAALAAAIPAPDPFQIEARRLLGGAVGLTTVQMDTAIASISATLRTNGFVPPPPHFPPPSSSFGPHLGFASPSIPIGAPLGTPHPAPRPFEGLIVAGSEHFSAVEIIHAIADSFGKPDCDLTTAISLAAGKPPPDAFFAADAAGLAAQAAEHWTLILAAAQASAPGGSTLPMWLSPPSSWLEAGRRLRSTADAAREARRAPQSTSAPAPRDETDRSVIPKASTAGKARSTAASGATIGCLTAAPIIAAEAAAVRVADPIGEARRIRDSSYGGPALTYLLSDGTVSGTMPNKCTLAPISPTPPPRTSIRPHIHPDPQMHESAVERTRLPLAAAPQPPSSRTFLSSLSTHPSHLIHLLPSSLIPSHLISSRLPSLSLPPLSSALVAASIVDAHDGLLEWAKEQIETVVVDVRAAQVSAEINSLAIGFLSLDIKYDEVVKLLGGRKPSIHGSYNKAGAWGSTLASSPDNSSSYITDVPLAMGNADIILQRLWIDVAGCDRVATGGIGLRVMATEAVSHLTPAHTKEFFEDFFTRIALAAHRMRSRRTVDLASGEPTLPLVDFAGLAAESVVLIQDPLIAKQASDLHVDARMEERRLAEAATAAKAGAKRTMPPAAASAPPSTTAAAAQPAPTATPALSKRKAKLTFAAATAAGSPAAATSTAVVTTSAPISSSPPPSPAPHTTIPPTDPTAWSTPTWAPGSITSLSRKVAGAGSAVQHFNWECARTGLAHFPCAIQSLTGTCRGAAGGCLTCKAQAALTTGATPVPVGILAKIKAAADADTARRIV